MRLLRSTLAPALVVVVAVILAASTVHAAATEPSFSSSLVAAALPTATDDDDDEKPPPNAHHFNEGFENGIRVARNVLDITRSVVLAFTPSELRKTWTGHERDVKQIFATALLTCFVIMAYNYNLLARARKLEKEIEERRMEEDEGSWKRNKEETTEDKLRDAKLKAVAVSAFANGRSLTEIVNKKSSSRSIAANLAQLDGIIDSGNFLSALLDQLWSRMSDAIEKTVRESLIPTLDGLAVPMFFVKMDLGDVPIRIQRMVIHRVNETYESSSGGISSYDDGNKQAGIKMDIDLYWDGNCDIMLQTKSAPKLAFGVRHIKFSGQLYVLLSPLTSVLPVISAIQVGFTNPPVVEMTYTGAGAILNTVASTIQGVIQGGIAGALVLPNRIVVPLDLVGYDYFDIYRPPVGMVRLSVIKSRGFKVLKGLVVYDVPDIYCVLRLGVNDPFRTSTKTDELKPSWKDESCDTILYDMDQKVYVDVYDADPSGLDTLLGKCEVTCRDLFGEGDDGVADGLCELELIMDEKRTRYYITVKAELHHLTNDTLDSFTKSEYDGKNRLCGLATIIVSKATNLPMPKEDAATFVKVDVKSKTGSKIFNTGTVMDAPGIDSLNPIYGCTFFVPITTAMLGTDKKESLTDLMGSSTKNLKNISMSSKIAKILNPVEAAGMVVSTSKMVVSAGAGVVSAGVGAIAMATATGPSNGLDYVLTLTDIVGTNGAAGLGDLGTLTVTHAELLEAEKHTLTKTCSIGDKGAMLEFRILLAGKFLL